MQDNPLRKLAEFGQSVWIDVISRSMISSGALQELIQRDDVRGVTSNPAIFEKAIGHSHDYDLDIRALAEEGKNAEAIFEALAVEDIRRAADVFRPVYQRLKGTDGFVSLEVSPRLALDTQGTIAEGRRLWREVGRPNLFIKVPATRQGLPAIQQLLSEGINVNITLLFGLPRYREVAEAYLAAMESRAAQGQPIGGIASVASFFLSRIDTLVDSLLEKIVESGGPPAELASSLRGRVAIASAKVAYKIYKEIFHSERFHRLAAQGARAQRLLWASTSTKNPAYSDVMYVESLIGPETVNTMPMETLYAYEKHGQPAPRLEEGLVEAEEVLHRLPELGIEIDLVTQHLEDEGIEKFVQPYDRLLKTIEKTKESLLQASAAH